MKHLRTALFVAAGAAVATACASSGGNHGTGATTGATGGGSSSSSSTTNATGSGGATTSGSVSSSSSSTGASVGASSSSGGLPPIGPDGGTLPTLSFAIVGDTRPPTEDDTAGYPTAIITKIWQDVEAVSPRPAFAVTTGDYMFANPFASQSGPQLDLYLGARAAFTNIEFPAMGNHECTGGTASNCGQGSTDGITNNYTSFMTKLLQPLGKSLPYYTIDIDGVNNAWTAKFVFVACSAWSSAQATWLDAELAKPTTYTFVVRHHGTSATTGPCLATSSFLTSAQIIAKHPLTALLVGHTHTFEYFASTKEVVTGNGGAPLGGSVDYGYVIAAQQPDMTIQFKAYDYMTNTVVQQFSMSP